MADKMTPEKISKSELFKSLSESEKVEFILFDYPNSTRTDIENKLFPVSPVSSVSSVSSVSGNKENKGNKGNRKQAIGVMLRRGINKGNVQVDKSGEQHKYSLTENGKQKIKQRYTDYKKEVDKILGRKQYEEEKENLTENLNSYLIQDDISSNIKNNLNQDNANVILNFIDISKYSPDLAFYLADNPKEFLDVARGIINKFESELGDNDYYISIKNLPPLL